jgi:ribonuclease HII
MDYYIAYQGEYLAGVDEAGRGPLAGPVIAAAVILDKNRPIIGLADSKKLSLKKREALYLEIKAKAKAYAIGRANWDEIDNINILRASLLAMSRAVAALSILPEYVAVDGKDMPKICFPGEAIIKGDSLVPEISAASILAKVERDNEMLEMDRVYPAYGFQKHKGYPTKSHLIALKMNGVSPIHRRSFKPVKSVLLDKTS